MMTFLLTFVCAFAQPSQTTTELGPVKVGENFPVFGGYTSKNEYISFRKTIGKQDIMIVSYFATWCAPCKENLPIIEKFIQKNDNVNGIPIVSQAGRESPYGLWGALGTRASNETVEDQLNQ